VHPYLLPHTMRVFAISLLLVLVSGCVSGPDKLQRSAPTWQFTTIDGALWAQSTNGKRHQLPAQGQHYHPLPSPDGLWLAVEIQRLSNLRTLQIFRVTAGGFQETAVNASSYLWQKARDIDAIDTDNLRYPAIRALNWESNSHSLDVELRGETADGEAYIRNFNLPIVDLLK